MADQINSYELPPTVYRVHYPSSATIFCSTGLHARDKTALLASTVHPKVLNHLNWECREPSPFISLFSDLACAKAFTADLKSKNGERQMDEEIWILEIDGRRLEVVKLKVWDIIPVGYLVRSGAFDKGGEDEWLVAHYIPWDAIRGPISLKEDQNGRKVLE